ncbi:hypothetical protein BJY16_007163 [Actinoplanes octamycinicus]|uniref:HEAT repeat protein n=1 Tax=Actinoplanes octamycinicus TaxID=135948 RepID=A0A7W7MB30_9ACTN|nr:HEAT repeat domain-containing protein [Actinoplanes octamycinicus]MBB4743704.1 hypothetical protein [Actinoplanes octamycinicus]GIE61132.1 hypothetical protein Aoc01nite_65340 [Actinoplanes octamycinicus]
MRSPREIIEETDWDAREHAYAAASDTPGRLLHLLSEDPERCGDALAYLHSAVLHQGSVYSATAPAAEFVAAILADPRTSVRCASALPWDSRSRPVRAALLEWLGAVADSAAWDGELDDDELAAFAACRAIRTDVFAAVEPFLDDTDASVRQAAVGAVTPLLAAPELADRRGPTAGRLMRSVGLLDPAGRAAVALNLGSWGIPPMALLADEHPAVRGCAAMTPALDDSPAALAEIQAALRDPRAADAWFGSGENRPAQLDGQVRFFLLQALLRRTTTFDEVADAAVAVARMTNAYTVDSDWGPLLARAFAGARGGPFSPAQRRFLAALVDNDECWGAIANPIIWLDAAGLPAEREQLRALVAV